MAVGFSSTAVRLWIYGKVMNEDGGQKIFDFLMEMIRLKELQRNELLPATREIQTNESYIEEYCTIRLNAGRQVGHTTAIMKLIEHFSLQKKKILVITLGLRFTQHLQRKMKIIGSEMERFVRFESGYNLIDNTRGCNSDLVIFDLFSISKFAKEPKELLRQLGLIGSQNKNFMIVLLG